MIYNKADQREPRASLKYWKSFLMLMQNYTVFKQCFFANYTDYANIFTKKSSTEIQNAKLM